MLRLNDIDSLYVAEDLSGFTKRLTDDGVVERQVDLLLLGFARAVTDRLRPMEKIRRHDLIRAGNIQPDFRLAVEAVAPWYATKLGLPQPSDSRSLLDLICRAGSAGLSTLQEEWKERSKSQIQQHIIQMITNKSTS